MAGVDIRVRCRSCFAVGDGDVSGYLPVYNMAEDTLSPGSRWWPRNVGRALITRSGSRGTAGRHLWSHQRFDKRARKFIGAESGKESSGEEEEGGKRERGGCTDGGTTFSLVNPGDDVLSY